MSSTILGALAFITVSVFGLLALAEVVRARGLARIELSRKISHIGSAVLMLMNPLFFSSGWPVLFLALSFALFLLVAVRLDLFPGTHALPRRSYGTAYFAMAIAALAYLFYDRHLEIYLAAVAVLGFGDGLAGVLGSALGKRRYHVGGSVRSLEGTATMFLVSCVAIVVPLVATGSAEPARAVVIALPVALLATAVEAVSPGGTDNLMVPGVTAAALYLMLYGAPGREVELALRVAAVAIAATGLALWSRLDVRRTVEAFVLGAALYGAGGPAWTLVALAGAAALVIATRAGRAPHLAGEPHLLRRLTLPAVAALGNALWPATSWLGLFVGSVAAMVGDAFAGRPEGSGRLRDLGEARRRRQLDWPTALAATTAVAVLLLVGRAWLEPRAAGIGVLTLLVTAAGAVAGFLVARLPQEPRPDAARGAEPRGARLPASHLPITPRLTRGGNRTPGVRGTRAAVRPGGGSDA